MPESEFNFFKDVKNLSMMGPVSIKTVNGPDYSQSTTNVNPYTNYGQHAAGGRIDNYGEERRTVSAQDLGPSNTVPDSEPRPVRVKSAPPVINSQSSSESLQQPPERPRPETRRHSTPSNAKDTSDSFAELWGEALKKYKAKTGFDIQDRKNDFVQLFDDCDNSNEALSVLEGLSVFKKPGARTTWVKIKDSLKKVLDVVMVLNGVAGEAGNAAFPEFGKVIFIGTGLLLRAIKDVSKQTEALEKLFSRLAAFLSRLEVRGRARIQPGSKRIIVKILVELLNALAIATVIVKGKFWNKVKLVSKRVFFDEDEIAEALSRLSELTEEESAMVLAELAASRADFEDLVKEVGGMDANVKGLALQIRSVIGIGNLDNKELFGLSSLLQSTKTDDKTDLLRVLKLLKIEDDGTKATLDRIATEVQDLRRSLARDVDRSTHETSDKLISSAAPLATSDDPSAGRMRDTYDTYDNYGQHITGGDVEIQGSQTTAPPVDFGSRQPAVRPAPPIAGSSRDTYGSYVNHGQHVTDGRVVIKNPKTIIKQ